MIVSITNHNFICLQKNIAFTCRLVGPSGTQEVDYRSTVMSGMMLGLNYQSLNPEGHSNPAAFLETSGQFLDGEREPLIQQNIIATHAFLSGLASGELYNADPNRWDEIPNPPLRGYSTDYDGVLPVDPERPAVPPEVSTADVMELVEYYDEADKFANDHVARSLELHLTAVSHYETKGQAEKVVKHMEGFKLLLDHQKGLMTDGTYSTLQAYADYLITKFDYETEIAS